MADFAALLLDANEPLRQNGFNQWLFYPGMVFYSNWKWWGDFGTRACPHEGVDFCLYEGANSQNILFNPGSAIPVIEDGIVRAVFKDYLGHAIVVEHDRWPESDRKLLSIYAHTDPLSHIQTGMSLEKGALIATTAYKRRSEAKILSHLHFSLGLASPGLTYEIFHWDFIRDPANITLLDPLKLIRIPYHQPRNQIPEKLINNAWQGL